jgi:hypothetical protein
VDKFVIWVRWYQDPSISYIKWLFCGIRSPHVKGFGCFAYLAFCSMPDDKRISYLLCSPYDNSKQTDTTSTTTIL